MDSGSTSSPPTKKQKTTPYNPNQIIAKVTSLIESMNSIDRENRLKLLILNDSVDESSRMKKIWDNQLDDRPGDDANFYLSLFLGRGRLQDAKHKLEIEDTLDVIEESIRKKNEILETLKKL